MTGLVVGATLGALASPRMTDTGAQQRRPTKLTSLAEGARSGTTREISIGGAPHTKVVSLPLTLETTPTTAPAVALAPTTTVAPPASTPSPTVPPEAATTTTEPGGTVVPSTTTPPVPTSPSTSTSTTPPVSTLCAQLPGGPAAKLDAGALRPALDHQSGVAYDVVVTLEAPQSGAPQQEQQLRMASLANFAGVGVERFDPLDATHVGARLQSGQLCRLVFLRPVVGLSVHAAPGS